jgi:signal transduction histidine kinase
MLALLGLHAIGLAAFGALTGNGLAHSAAEGAALAVAALLAAHPRLGRRGREAVASVGLITASAVLVHLGGGYVELHFHFFVMIAVIALYQDWVPIVLALGYVVLHHGVLGVLAPTTVYNHPDAFANPWKWAAIHGSFILAASAVSIVHWRLNEAAAAEMQAQSAVNRRLQAEIAQRQRAEAALRAANAELEQFAYTVSHDLKAPLTAIQGLAAALEEDAGPALGDEGRHYLARIAANAGRLGRLIGDVLAFSRVGQVGAPPAPVDLAAALAAQREALLGRETPGGPTVSAATPLPTVRTSPTLVHQVLENLLANALAYGHAPGEAARVEVGCDDAGDAWRLWVRDHGPGVPQDQQTQTRIFRLFERLPAGVAAHPGGTGVGLGLVRKAAAALGGATGVEAPPDGGARFWVTFPKAPAAGA